jgi:hypothetical protein
MMHFAAPVTTPQQGERWHVQIPGAIALVTVNVLQVTANTISFQIGNVLPDVRYEHGAVRFVEKAQ